jgi:hypothetical protein
MHGMTPAEILRAIQADLKEWAGTVRGQISIAKDPWNVLEILSESPVGVRVILHWAGDKQLGDWDDAPLATANIEVVLGYAMGLVKDPGGDLVNAQFNARPSVLDLVSDLRGRLLSRTVDSDPGSPDESADTLRYVGTEPVTLPDGTPTHAYRMKFELDHALPEFTVRAS